jgi:predicted DNA-binding transcriptional regulator YafY
VAERADKKLATAAQNALARIGGVIPVQLAHRIENQHLVVGPAADPAIRQVDLSVFRAAIRNERKLRIAYIDSKGVGSDRVIWPFQIGFFDGVTLLSAWCESRNGIRHFRTDRIESAVEAGGRYPKRRHELVTMWQKIERPDKVRP